MSTSQTRFITLIQTSKVRILKVCNKLSAKKCKKHVFSALHEIAAAACPYDAYVFLFLLANIADTLAFRQQRLSLLGFGAKTHPNFELSHM